MASGEVRKKPTKDDSSDSEDGTVTKSPPKKIRKQAKKGRGSIEKPKQKKVSSDNHTWEFFESSLNCSPC